MVSIMSALGCGSNPTHTPERLPAPAMESTPGTCSGAELVGTVTVGNRYEVACELQESYVSVTLNGAVDEWCAASDDGGSGQAPTNYSAWLAWNCTDEVGQPYWKFELESVGYVDVHRGYVFVWSMTGDLVGAYGWDYLRSGWCCDDTEVFEWQVGSIPQLTCTPANSGAECQ